MGGTVRGFLPGTEAETGAGRAVAAHDRLVSQLWLQNTHRGLSGQDDRHSSLVAPEEGSPGSRCWHVGPPAGSRTATCSWCAQVAGAAHPLLRTLVPS